jgi:hypothetical protein
MVRSVRLTACEVLGPVYGTDLSRLFIPRLPRLPRFLSVPSAPSLEASLDIQYISSIGFGATTWWISDDDTHNQQEPFLAYMVLLSNTTDTPWVHSISYADLEWSQNTAYTQRVDTEMAKAGLRGKLGIFFHGSMVFFRQQFPNTIINIIF